MNPGKEVGAQSDSRQSFRNMLLISGTGRGSGKTALAVSILGKYRDYRNIIGIKISSHFHSPQPGLEPVLIQNGIRVFKESSIDSRKDSSRMLQAGASVAYYIQVKDKNLEEAVSFLFQNFHNNIPVICESPSLRNFVLPGVFIIVHRSTLRYPKKDVLNQKAFADLFTYYDGTVFDFDTVRILLKGNNWLLKPSEL